MALAGDEHKTRAAQFGASRRRVIGTAVALAAADMVGAVGAAIVSMEIEPSHFSIRRFDVGNGSTLTVLETEHWPTEWDANKNTILKEIANATIVVPEYFPAEWQSLKEIPIIGTGVEFYEGATTFFTNALSAR
jgi:hypothetical protein